MLSEWAYRFTANVHIYKADTLLLEVGRSLKLFKGSQHLKHLICHGLEELRLDSALGFASTPKAAYVLSFYVDEDIDWNVQLSTQRLRQAFLEHLELSDQMLKQLQQCGFTQLQDILSISHKELGQRFGQELLIYLDQLLGKLADPKEFIAPKEVFKRTVDFAQPISNQTWIDQQLLRLLTELVAFIQERQLVCQSFAWRFYKEDQRLVSVDTISLSSTKADVATFKELSDLKLANKEFKSAFSSIELHSDALICETLFNNDLFNPKPDLEAFNQLIEKLASRLGHDALFKVAALNEHLPELANQQYPYTHQSGSHQIAESHSDYGIKDEPVWLLKQPEKLAVVRQENLIHGPHRVNSHWWKQLQSRDYYIARQPSGQLAWVYYEHLQRSWYLHGLFA